MSPTDQGVAEIQRRFEALANPDTKRWFENYLKGVIDYRGLKSPEVAKTLKAFMSEHPLETEEQVAVGQRMAQSNFAEDKFAAFLLWAQALKDGFPTSAILDEAERMFDGGHVYDWSTSDWLCVRVVGACLRLGNARDAKRVEGWWHSQDLWQRRSSIVGFLKVVKEPRHHPPVRRLVKRLVTEEARFIQTGVGWVLAELSRSHPELSAELFEAHFEHFSREVIDRHTKHLAGHAEYKRRKRAE